MKKLLPLLVIAVFTLLVTSCTKDYNCTCTYNTNGILQTTVTHMSGVTKTKANEQCSGTQKAYHGNLGYTYITCGLD